MTMRRSLAGTLVLAVVVGTTASAQSEFSLSPSVGRGDDGAFAVGARYRANWENPGKAHLGKVAWYNWYAAAAEGTYLHRATESADPLLAVAADIGAQFLLPNSRRDNGYVVLTARLSGEADQPVEEAFLAVGGAFQYVPPSRYSAFGIGFLVPRITVEVGLSRFVRSRIRDDLGLDDGEYGRLAIETDWTFRFARTAIPSSLRPLRLDFHLAHYVHSNVEAAVEDSIGASGRFIGATLGYEFTDRVSWLRHAFVRVSDGEHAAIPVGRRNLLVGITLAPAK